MRSLNRRYGRRHEPMAWLFTRNINTINTAIINMVSSNTGMICDGASNSCAMKMSSVSAFKAVRNSNAKWLRWRNDGIVCADVEQTINNLCRLVIKPMTLTDKEIISTLWSLNNTISRAAKSRPRLTYSTHTIIYKLAGSR